MTADPIATRYAQALFETAKASDEIEETLEQLSFIGQLMRDEPSLRQVMRNPHVNLDEKVALLARSLKGGWSELVHAFIRLVVSWGRVEHFLQIAEAFSALVDVEQARARVVVRTAHAIPDAVLARLRTRLEQRERKHIELETELDPALLGGLQVVLGHRVIDGTIQRQLAELRERLLSVRVHEACS